MLDFDETLVSTTMQTRRFLNHRFGIQMPLENSGYLCGHSLYDLVKQYLPVNHELDEATLYQILGSEFLASSHWHEDVCPVEGAQDAVTNIAKQHKIYVATARQNTSMAVVKMLLEKFFPACVQDVHCVWTHLGNGAFNGVSKKEFIQKLGRPFAYVDDNPKETCEIHGSTDHVLLFDPNMYHCNVTDSRRVTSWREIEKILL